MATTVQTILKQARNAGGFIGVTLKQTKRFAEEAGTVKVASVGSSYVTLRHPITGYPVRVHKNTIKQVRYNGRAINRR